VQGAGVRFQGLRHKVYNLGFEVHGWFRGLGFRF
jgi:hypothetical protein